MKTITLILILILISLNTFAQNQQMTKDEKEKAEKEAYKHRLFSAIQFKMDLVVKVNGIIDSILIENSDATLKIDSLKDIYSNKEKTEYLKKVSKKEKEAISRILNDVDGKGIKEAIKGFESPYLIHFDEECKTSYLTWKKDISNDDLKIIYLETICPKLKEEFNTTSDLCENLELIKKQRREEIEIKKKLAEEKKEKEGGGR